MRIKTLRVDAYKDQRHNQPILDGLHDCYRCPEADVAIQRALAAADITADQVVSINSWPHSMTSRDTGSVTYIIFYRDQERQ